MARDLLKGEEGRFFRGNLHCHSDRSDGLRSPERVVAAYRGAGYDFLCLSDHFEEEYGWRVTDTRSLRDDDFTTIVGAELSSAPWDERDCYWVTAAGLPPDFGAPPPDDHAEAIRRAADVGALVVMLHPGLNNLPLAAADGLPAFDAIHAVEVYNHNQAMAALPDRAHGAYMLDGLLEKGHRLLVNAGDDAHFGHPLDRFGGWVEVYNHNQAMAALPDRAHGAYMLDGLLEKGHRLLVNAGDDAHFGHPLDRFGGWVEVHCDRLDPDALLDSMKAGRYYSTQGPALREMLVDGNRLRVASSDAYAITLTGSGDRWQSGQEHTGAPITEAEFDLAPFRGSYCRVTVVDAAGRRAWGNPIWP